MNAPVNTTPVSALTIAPVTDDISTPPTPKRGRPPAPSAGASTSSATGEPAQPTGNISVYLSTGSFFRCQQ